MDVLPVRAGKSVSDEVRDRRTGARPDGGPWKRPSLPDAPFTGSRGYTFGIPALLKSAGFQWFVPLPTVMLMLVIASSCKNMWVSLGIGVILVFTMSIFPQDNLILSLSPVQLSLSNAGHGGGKRPRPAVSGRLRRRNRGLRAAGACPVKKSGGAQNELLCPDRRGIQENTPFQKSC